MPRCRLVVCSVGLLLVVAISVCHPVGATASIEVKADASTNTESTGDPQQGVAGRLAQASLGEHIANAKGATRHASGLVADAAAKAVPRAAALFRGVPKLFGSGSSSSAGHTGAEQAPGAAPPPEAQQDAQVGATDAVPDSPPASEATQAQSSTHTPAEPSDGDRGGDGSSFRPSDVIDGIKGAAAKVAHTAKAWTGAASQRAREAASELADGVSAAPNVAAHVADALREAVWNATAELAEEALGVGRSESVQTIRTVVRGIGLLALPLLLIFVLRFPPFLALLVSAGAAFVGANFVWTLFVMLLTAVTLAVEAPVLALLLLAVACAVPWGSLLGELIMHPLRPLLRRVPVVNWFLPCPHVPPHAVVEALDKQHAKLEGLMAAIKLLSRQVARVQRDVNQLRQQAKHVNAQRQ